MLEKIASWTKNNIGLLIITAFFLCVVLYCFGEQGLINWDEAYFVVVTDTYSSLFRTALSRPADLFSAPYYHDLISRYGNIYTAARPSYILPAAVLGLIVPAQYATRLVSVLSGLLALVFFHRLTALLGLKKKVRYAAAFLLAASPLFLSYSRLGLSQLFSAAWLIVAVYYLLAYHGDGEKKNLRKAGLALSILLMSHYNTLFVVAGLLAVGAFFILRRKRPAKEYLLFFVFFLLLPVAYEAITRAGVAIASAKGLLGSGSNFPIYTYSREIIEQFMRNGSQTVSEPGLMLYYVKMLVSPEGLIFCVLFLIGLAVVVVRIRKSHEVLVLLPALLHLVIFSFVGIKFTRNLITIVPALYIVSALGLGAVADFLKPKLTTVFTYGLFALFFAAVLFLNFWQYKNLLTIKTHFSEVASFIREKYDKEQALIISASAPFWRVYLPGYRSEMTREVAEWSGKYPERKIVFIDDYFTTIVDEKSYLDGYAKQPLRKWSTNIFSARPIILDFIYQSEEQNNIMFAANEKSSPVVVYELSKLPE
jgi:hypothetical protein